MTQDYAEKLCRIAEWATGRGWQLNVNQRRVWIATGGHVVVSSRDEVEAIEAKIDSILTGITGYLDEKEIEAQQTQERGWFAISAIADERKKLGLSVGEAERDGG